MSVSIFKLMACASLAVTTLAAPLIPHQDPVSECVLGLYILVARGSMETANQGRTTAVAQAIAARVPDSAIVGVDYPAAIFGNGDGTVSLTDLYPVGVAEGAGDVKDKLRAYVDKCGPDSQIALLGYSQGANAISDALAGGLLRPIPLSTRYRSNIKAIALFADPSFTRRQPANVGTNTERDGIYARLGLSLRRLNSYSNVTQSYCDRGDFFCATGGSLAVHSATVPEYTDEAVEFVVSRARGMHTLVKSAVDFIEYEALSVKYPDL